METLQTKEVETNSTEATVGRCGVLGACMRTMALWAFVLSGSLQMARGADSVLEIRYRYLFVLDTSAGMAPQRAAIREWLRETISSGLDGWLVRGETVGFWTFQDQLARDAIPAQKWDARHKDRLARQAEEMIRSTGFQGVPRPDRALRPALDGARNLERLTILYLSDGYGDLQGTPFDELINSCYRSARSSGPSAKTRDDSWVVTRLEIRSGQVTGWSVTRPDGSLVEAKGAELASALNSNTAVASAPTASSAGTSVSSRAADHGGTTTEIARNDSVVQAVPAPAANVLPPSPVLSPELTRLPEITPLQLEDEERLPDGKIVSRTRSPVLWIDVTQSSSPVTKGSNTTPVEANPIVSIAESDGSGIAGFKSGRSNSIALSEQVVSSDPDSDGSTPLGASTPGGKLTESVAKSAFRSEAVTEGLPQTSHAEPSSSSIIPRAAADGVARVRDVVAREDARSSMIRVGAISLGFAAGLALIWWFCRRPGVSTSVISRSFERRS